MNPTLETLLTLQEIDREIFRVENELTRLPAELAERQVEFDRRTTRLAELQATIAAQISESKEIENITTTQRQRQRKLEGQRDSTKDVALGAAYDHEIRSLRRSISMGEDDALKGLERVERLESEASDLQATIDAERKIFDVFRGNVERETGEAQTRLASLKTDLASRSSNDIDATHLSIYRGLLQRREGEALAHLDGLICQGCYTNVPKNVSVRLARGTEFVQCPSCDRILYSRY